MVERVTTIFPLLLNFARPGITHCVTKSWVLNLFLSHMILLFILERKILCIVPACAWQLSNRTLHLEIHTAYLNSDRKYSASSGLEMFLGIFPKRTISQEISKSHKLLMAFWSHVFVSWMIGHSQKQCITVSSMRLVKQFLQNGNTFLKFQRNSRYATGTTSWASLNEIFKVVGSIILLQRFENTSLKLIKGKVLIQCTCVFSNFNNSW